MPVVSTHCGKASTLKRVLLELDLPKSKKRAKTGNQ